MRGGYILCSAMTGAEYIIYLHAVKNTPGFRGLAFRGLADDNKSKEIRMCVLYIPCAWIYP